MDYADNPIRRAHTKLADEQLAVAALAADLQQADLAAVLLFCSTQYDPERLASALQAHFSCSIIACTTAGEIGPHYQKGGLVGVSLAASHFAVQTVDLETLDSLDGQQVRDQLAPLGSHLRWSRQLDPKTMFAFLLIDGLSMREEFIAATVHPALEGVSLIGGSAGDNLTFTRTQVLVDGQFKSNAAVLALIETTLAFTTFKFQHYQPTPMDMVVTEADPAARLVREINGAPAAQELAQIIGIAPQDLTLEVYSTHPVMVQIGDDWYVRSIQHANEDGSLSFACAIDNGLPLTVGHATDIVAALRADVQRLHERLPTVLLTIGCDCVHRTLEIASKKLKPEVEALLEDLRFVGFSTYGEQYNAIHVNQTLTGIAIGLPGPA